MKNIILPEIVAAGIYNAQSAIKNRTVSKNRKTTMFELELPIGEGGISYIDDTSHEINERLVISAKPGQTRHTRLPFRCYYVHMIVSDGYLFDVLSAFPNYIELRETEKIKEIFASISEEYSRTTANDELMLQSLILKLIHILFKEVRISKKEYRPKSNNSEVIEETVRYIKENITEDLSLSALSARINFSPIYFHKLFKASTGKNLREYIEEQRIKKAAELLISTEKPLTAIAYECGFSSQSYFSYAFKRRMKVTPREYAKCVHLKYEKQ